MGDVVVGPWGSFIDDNELIDDYVDDLGEIIFDEMREIGFDNLGEMKFTKDLALIKDSIRSYLLKLRDSYHPVQDVADALYVLDENMSSLYMNNSIDVVFLPEED